MILTQKQGQGVKAIQQWFKRGIGTFRLFGYAGTGKSTILKYALGELGLDPHEYVVMTATGKAAHVLRQKGTTNAINFHGLIYKLCGSNEGLVAKLTEELSSLEKSTDSFIQLGTGVVDRVEYMFRLKQKIKEAARLHFEFQPEALEGKRLIVLDEVSMVDEAVACDILSYNLPVLVLGDPGQLPPIGRPSVFIQGEPDIMLTEIHRQAWDSPIIELATRARKGEYLRLGSYGPGVSIRERPKHGEAFLEFDQVLAGKNETVKNMNRQMREAKGYLSPFPENDDERIICLKNNHDLGLFNGMFLRVTDRYLSSATTMHANVRDRDDVNAPRHYKPLGLGTFYDHKAPALGSDIIHASFGYCITTHKAQGSEWGNVGVIIELFAQTPGDNEKWLYTAITRASERLTLFK